MALSKRTQQWRAAAVANPEGFARKKIAIPDLMGRTVPLVYNHGQQQVSERKKEIHKSGKPLRLWVLKYRRCGISMLETYENWCYIYGNDNARVAILAHLESRAQELLDENVKLFDSCLVQGDPGIAIPKSRDNVFGLKYVTNSQMLIATAENAVRVRGGGIHRAQLTEGAWYFNLFNNVMEEIGPVVPAKPGSQVVIETTGTLIGSQPHDHWLAAELGQNEFETMFLNWLDNPALVKPFRNDLHKGEIMQRIQDVEPRLLELCRFFKLLPEQIHQAWDFYHYQCRNNFEIFCREFPMSKEMAWTAGGDSYFGVYEVGKAKPQRPEHTYLFEYDTVAAIFKDPAQLRAVEGVDDYTVLPQLKVWQLPRKNARYVIGADSSLGDAGGDYSAGYMIDIETREMMCAYHGLLRPDQAAHIIVSLCRMYNNAIAAPETNPAGGGYEALNSIQRLGYHRIYQWRRRDGSKGIENSKALGWWSNSWSRPLMLGELRKIFQDCMKGNIPDNGMFRDIALVNEMRTFGIGPDGIPRANAGCHDDRVIACGIAHQVANDETYLTSKDKLLQYSKTTMPKPDPDKLLIARDPNRVMQQFLDPRSAFNRNEFDI